MSRELSFICGIFVENNIKTQYKRVFALICRKPKTMETLVLTIHILIALRAGHHCFIAA